MPRELPVTSATLPLRAPISPRLFRKSLSEVTRRRHQQRCCNQQHHLNPRQHRDVRGSPGAYLSSFGAGGLPLRVRAIQTPYSLIPMIKAASASAPPNPNASVGPGEARFQRCPA